MESYRIDHVEYGRTAKPADYAVTDRVLEAFRNYIRKEQAQHLQPAQLESDLDFARLRLRTEMITAAFGADAGQRHDIDPQTLRAVGVLPEAKRLAESIRNGTPISLDFKPLRQGVEVPGLPAMEVGDEIII